MISYRIRTLILVSVSLLLLVLLRADDAPPFLMEKQYSADVTITMKAGTVIKTKTYVDGDKMRSDSNVNGMQIGNIVRKDRKKMYNIMESQKMVMEMDFAPEKLKSGGAASFGPEGKFELIGSDTVDGVACTKYKVTSAKNDIFYFWLDAAKKVPVQMSPDDGSFSVRWTNYKVGPQDAALFEPPADYKVMSMPSMPAMPGGDSGSNSQ